jgi:hypothetical protein
LINLYQLQNDKDKAIKEGLALVSLCSSDGWNWDINRFVGDICAENGQWDLAAIQYNLALQGINKQILIQAQRLSTLYESGNAFKSDHFISWEDEAFKFQKDNIDELEKLLKEANSR